MSDATVTLLRDPRMRAERAAHHRARIDHIRSAAAHRGVEVPHLSADRRQLLARLESLLDGIDDAVARERQLQVRMHRDAVVGTVGTWLMGGVVAGLGAAIARRGAEMSGIRGMTRPVAGAMVGVGLLAGATAAVATRVVVQGIDRRNDAALQQARQTRDTRIHNLERLVELEA